MKKYNAWPIGISIFIVLFLVVTIATALYFGSQKVDMVEKNYYERGEKYQSDIDARHRAMALAEKPVIRYDSGSRTCIVDFPDTTLTGDFYGTAHFYCASDAQSDFRAEIGVRAARQEVYSLAGRANGNWTVTLRWNKWGTDYLHEEKILVR